LKRHIENDCSNVVNLKNSTAPVQQIKEATFYLPEKQQRQRLAF